MADTSIPKKSNLVRSFLIPLVVIVIAQIVGRTAAGGEVDQQFLVQAIIRGGIAAAIVYGLVWMIRSRRSRNDK